MSDTRQTHFYRTPYKVVLQTSDGEHVATASILPFQLNPTVLIWGSRIFLETKLQAKVEGKFVPIYREGYPWTVLHTDECGDVFPTTLEEAGQ